MTYVSPALAAAADPPSRYGDLSAPRAIRCNNPLALKDFGVPWQGLVTDQNFETGARKGGRHCVFATPAYGFRAGIKNLRTYMRRDGLRTIRQIIEKWAPRNADGNHTDEYIAYVAGRTGRGPDVRLKETPVTLADLAAAMADVESGWTGYWSRAQINAGAAMAFGLPVPGPGQDLRAAAGYLAEGFPPAGLSGSHADVLPDQAARSFDPAVRYGDQTYDDLAGYALRDGGVTERSYPAGAGNRMAGDVYSTVPIPPAADPVHRTVRNRRDGIIDGPFAGRRLEGSLGAAVVTFLAQLFADPDRAPFIAKMIDRLFWLALLAVLLFGLTRIARLWRDGARSGSAAIAQGGTSCSRSAAVARRDYSPPTGPARPPAGWPGTRPEGGARSGSAAIAQRRFSPPTGKPEGGA